MANNNHSRRLFLGCFIGLVATAFGFAVRGAVLKDWEVQFNLTEEQKGIINGVGLFPFAISIILLSLVVDRIGYGTTMALAFVGHLASAVMTIFAPNFEVLYIATFIYALANGAVEAVINPVVATIHRENKTHWLNILHAGWPGGLVLGGLLSILVLSFVGPEGATAEATADTAAASGFKPWQWQMAILLLPIFAYGVLLFGQKFPQQERVEAGVSYQTMLEEFGWGSAFIVSFLMIMGISQMLIVAGLEPIRPAVALGVAVIPAAIFAFYVRSFGRPMFVFLTLVMFLLATTELGTDAWIQDIIGSVRANPTTGTWFLIYTSAIMFVLRFFAGPIVHRISPLGLLASCAAIAAAGLYWLGNAGTALGTLIAAATLYAFGKTFFWPTTLGVVSEQYPRGGALLINAISGIGMISIGTIGGPAMGTLQDRTLASAVAKDMPPEYDGLKTTATGLFSDYEALDKAKIDALPEVEKSQVTAIQRQTKQQALASIAVLPAIMCACYLVLIAYFKLRGGYQAEVLAGHAANDEQFTGGVPGAVEA
jgi:MFS family permease